MTIADVAAGSFVAECVFGGVEWVLEDPGAGLVVDGEIALLGERRVEAAERWDRVVVVGGS